jgi:anti-sigma B factor antagonist/stage II sporulation protein AA (anti-sigma F factor antagonist)
LEIGETRRGQILVLTPVGRIDNETSPAFQAKLLGAVGANGATVLLDMSKVDYLSSVGLRALMVASKQAKAVDGRMAVASLHPMVKEIFAISRFNYVIQVFDGVDDAVAAWS